MPRQAIVLFVDSLVAAGAQRQIVLLAQQLKVAGYTPQVLIYHEILDLKPSLDVHEIPVTILKRRELGPLRMLVEVFRYFQRLRPVAIVAYLHGPSVLARVLGRLAGVRVIITSERSISLHRSRLTYWSERLTWRLSSAIVTNTHAGRDVLLREGRVPPDRLVVIYNGIDLSVYSPGSPRQRQVYRESHGVDQRTMLVVLPGRIVAEKNHECLVRAIARMGPNQPIKALFVGQEIDKRLGADLRALAGTLGVSDRIIFAGPSGDMASVYAAADVVVLPSVSEALPNVIIEAMACEKVIVASRIADNDMLIEQGQSGFLFATGDDEALAAALQACSSLDQEQARRIGVAARERISMLCSTDGFRRDYVALIERSCGFAASAGGAS